LELIDDISRLQGDDLGRAARNRLAALGAEPHVAERCLNHELEGVAGVCDLRHLVLRVFFNLYVGNNDSHAKNLSIYSVPGQGAMLTPFYDRMCTRMYPGLSPEFAFAIGGEVRPGGMGAGHLALMARQLGMQPRFLALQARDMAERVPTAIDQATREIAPLLTPSARTLAARLERFVVSTARKLADRITAER